MLGIRKKFINSFLFYSFIVFVTSFSESYLFVTNTTLLLAFSEVTSFDVRKVIHSCESDSKGVDGLSISYFKRGIEVLIPHLIDIFNLSLTSSVFPRYLEENSHPTHT